MGRIYELMDDGSAETLDGETLWYLLRSPKIPVPEGSTLKVVHRPLDRDGRVSLWPYGFSVTDDDGIESVGWIERRALLVWGANRDASLERELARYGVRLAWVG